MTFERALISNERVATNAASAQRVIDEAYDIDFLCWLPRFIGLPRSLDEQEEAKTIAKLLPASTTLITIVTAD